VSDGLLAEPLSSAPGALTNWAMFHRSRLAESTLPEGGCQLSAAMKTPIPDAARTNASPSGTACDIRAFIKI